MLPEILGRSIVEHVDQDLPIKQVYAHGSQVRPLGAGCEAGPAHDVFSHSEGRDRGAFWFLREAGDAPRLVDAYNAETFRILGIDELADESHVSALANMVAEDLTEVLAVEGVPGKNQDILSGS